MCRGNEVEMACGHMLRHYTRKCAVGRQTRPCTRPDNFHLEDGSERTYLADTCATCDPGYRMTRVRQARDKEQTALMRELHEAQEAKDIAEQQSIMREMDLLALEANNRIGEITASRGRGRGRNVLADVSSVLFPAPKTNVRLVGDCKWVKGRCVWEVVKDDDDDDDYDSVARQRGERKGGRRYEDPRVAKGPIIVGTTEKRRVRPEQEHEYSPPAPKSPRRNTNDHPHSRNRVSEVVNEERPSTARRHSLRRVKNQPLKRDGRHYTVLPDYDFDAPSPGQEPLLSEMQVSSFDLAEPANPATTQRSEVSEESDMWLKLADSPEEGNNMSSGRIRYRG